MSASPRECSALVYIISAMGGAQCIVGISSVHFEDIMSALAGYHECLIEGVKCIGGTSLLLWNTTPMPS